MSLKLMTAIWEHAPVAGSRLLLLLALADFAHDDGTSVYPSVALMATKTRLDRRTVQRLLRALERDGYLTRVPGTGRGQTTHYHLSVRGGNLPPPPAQKGGIQCSKGRHPVLKRAASDAQKGGVVPPKPLEPLEPLENREERARRAPARASSAPASFEPTAEQREWAARAVPGVDLDAETAQWLDHHRAKGSQFKDWAASWRTWMRNTVKYNRGGSNGRHEAGYRRHDPLARSQAGNPATHGPGGYDSWADDPD